MPKIYKYPCDDNTTCSPIEVNLIPGKYLIECYGAEGGTGLTNSQKLHHGGRGAYASGILNLKKSTPFYLYIGGRGEDGPNNHEDIAHGGWNGGADSGRDIGTNDEPDTSAGGGGATDIRLVRAPDGKEAEDEESLNSRIIVAAGGSGSAFESFGAPGGDLKGYKVNAFDAEMYIEVELSADRKGQGENGKDHEFTPSSGSGAGYYGGIASEGRSDNQYLAVSSSGTSYVAGYQNCEKLPSDNLYSVFDYRLMSPFISNGFSEFPSLNYETTKETEIGHIGNGAIKITHLDFCSVGKEQRSEFILFSIVFVLSNSK